LAGNRQGTNKADDGSQERREVWDIDSRRRHTGKDSKRPHANSDKNHVFRMKGRVVESDGESRRRIREMGGKTEKEANRRAKKEDSDSPRENQ